MKNIDTRCIVLVLLLITSCTTPPKKHLDETLQEAQKPWQGIRWWQAFHDPLLNKFAHQIIAQNLDIQVAAARLTAARAVSTQVISGLYPDISFASLESRVKNRFFLNQPTYGLNGLIVNWELDVFGQVRAGIRAANARIGVAAVNVDDMRNLVVADLTKAVIDWRQAQQTVKFTESLLKAEDEQIRLFDYRTKAGLIDASFLERARAERAQILAQLPEAKASANDAEHQIERLLGDTDHQVTTALVQASPMSLNIPAPNKTLAITIDIIQNRPDVRKARFDLLAAQADLDQAEANLWPKISILSFFGVENGSSTARLAAGNPVWAIASLVTAPILNFGRLRGAIDEKNAEAKAMELTYENTILLA